MSHVTDVDTAGFNEQVIQRSHEVPVVVDFWAEWCGPCKTLGPTLERLTDEAGGVFELAKVDVDQNQELAGQMGVQGIPTVVAFKDGLPVSQFTGALPEAKVKEWLAEFMPNPMDDFITAADDLHDHGRIEEAAAMYRKVLEADATHEEAAIALASIMLEAGDTESALAVLEPVPSSAGVDRFRAVVRLATEPGAPTTDLEAAVASAPDNAGALDHLLEVVLRKGELTDDARTVMLDVFEVLGADSPITQDYRRRLANALF